MEEEKITTPASEETEPKVISPEESTVAEDVVSEDANTGKKEKKPKNKLLPLWIVLGIIAGIAVIVAIIAIANAGCKASMMKYVDTFGPTEKANKLVPTIEDGYYTFTTNEDFKVMQLTDIHIGGGFGSFSRDKKALNAVDAMIKAEKPDFIVVTGDMAFPVPYSSVTFNNMTGLTEFFTFMENQQIYWTLTFGNHDTEAYSYYNTLKRYTEESGGLFTPVLSDYQGNIRCLSNPTKRVHGWVLASSVTTKRIFIYEENFEHLRSQYSNPLCIAKHRTAHKDEFNAIVTPYPPLSPWVIMAVDANWRYDPNAIAYNWFCVDCRYTTGATKKRPDFWPNDHE